MEFSYEMDLQMIEEYRLWLIEQEKSKNTISKYVRDVMTFYHFLSAGDDKKVLLCKLRVMEYKEYLQETHTVTSVNSMLVALNRFLQYKGWQECCVRLLKCQRQIFRDEQRELTKEEYLRLVNTAKKKGKQQLALVIETLCATGIRVSELKYITVESVAYGRAVVTCKGKHRVILLPNKLCKMLSHYIQEKKIETGFVFCTRTGNPLDRSNIWQGMKNLCKEAAVVESKVFPHNLRHLFARIFYAIEKNIVHLADVLGHSSIETTRVYTISTGLEHSKQINRLGLVV